MSKLLEIKDFVKEYENITALKGISFDVNEGEFLSILGPSGCGKTTLLRILIGIENVDRGNLFKNGVDITNAAPNERNMGIVFQNYDLFPNMTVLQNVKYPLVVNKNTRANADEIAMDIIKKVGLENFIDEFPQNISGGQQQRVAIARTLALKPDIILFDEPMSALDAVIKQSLRKELKRMQKEFNLTMIYITHDQEEAFSMSDRIMVMNNGVIEQIDKPSVIFNEPKNEYVKEFVINHLTEKVQSIEKSIGVNL